MDDACAVHWQWRAVATASQVVLREAPFYAHSREEAVDGGTAAGYHLRQIEVRKLMSGRPGQWEPAMTDD